MITTLRSTNDKFKSNIFKSSVSSLDYLGGLWFMSIISYLIRGGLGHQLLCREANLSMVKDIIKVAWRDLFQQIWL